jgi:hypothetical protein
VVSLLRLSRRRVSFVSLANVVSLMVMHGLSFLISGHNFNLLLQTGPLIESESSSSMIGIFLLSPSTDRTQVDPSYDGMSFDSEPPTTKTAESGSLKFDCIDCSICIVVLFNDRTEPYFFVINATIIGEPSVTRIGKQGALNSVNRAQLPLFHALLWPRRTESPPTAERSSGVHRDPLSFEDVEHQGSGD